MYDVSSYVGTNELGTAVLLEAVSRHPVERLIIASSMSVYGEGLARRNRGELVSPRERSYEQIRRGVFELTDTDGERLTPAPTPEDNPPTLNPLYPLHNFTHEPHT